jgi:hypothetical protein
MDIRETEWGGMDLIDLSEDRDCTCEHVMNIRVPKKCKVALE